MRCGIALRSLALTTVLLTAALPLFSQQAPDTFRWIDFHSPKDQDVVTWATRQMARMGINSSTGNPSGAKAPLIPGRLWRVDPEATPAAPFQNT